MSFVVMGYTRGDDLIPPTAKALFSSPDRESCEKKMAQIQSERDDWLSKNVVPYYAQCVVFSRFAVVETPFDALQGDRR